MLRAVSTMTQTTLAFLLFALSAFVNAGESALESRFARERGNLACFEGATSEQSCGGTGMSVYINGDRIRHLDWTIETSSQFIRRQYYFEGASPRLVVETIHAKFDVHGEPLEAPHLLSTEHYRLDQSQPTAQQKEFRDHARFLVNDFSNHRKDFSRVFHP
jgi:hypothetical protein